MYTFCGNFRDLVPAGYTFAKLYARNYRCYYKDATYNTIWIWQSKRSVEIDDLYSNSGLIIDKVLYEENPEFGWAINTQDGVIEVFDFYKHSLLIRKNCDEITKEEYLSLLPNWPWRRFSISDLLISEVKKLHQLGWIRKQ